MENQMDLLSNLNADNTLPEIQKYIEKVLEIRGFNSESIQNKLLHLSEELGELIKAVRKYSPDTFVDPNHMPDYGSVEEEIADVLIMLIAVANKLGIDLFECLKNKEQVNVTRAWIKSGDCIG